MQLGGVTVSFLHKYQDKIPCSSIVTACIAECAFGTKVFSWASFASFVRGNRDIYQASASAVWGLNFEHAFVQCQWYDDRKCNKFSLCPRSLERFHRFWPQSHQVEQAWTIRFRDRRNGIAWLYFEVTHLLLSHVRNIIFNIYFFILLNFFKLRVILDDSYCRISVEELNWNQFRKFLTY